MPDEKAIATSGAAPAETMYSAYGDPWVYMVSGDGSIKAQMAGTDKWLDVAADSAAGRAIKSQIDSGQLQAVQGSGSPEAAEEPIGDVGPPDLRESEQTKADDAYGEFGESSTTEPLAPINMTRKLAKDMTEDDVTGITMRALGIELPESPRDLDRQESAGDLYRQSSPRGRKKGKKRRAGNRPNLGESEVDMNVQEVDLGESARDLDLEESPLDEVEALKKAISR
jgi:hypothetical protein